jgi:polysaccharide export outer membrane protein
MARHSRIGRTMTFLRCTLLSIILLPALDHGLAQQTPAKPAPAAKPSATPAITQPANSTTTARPATNAPAINRPAASTTAAHPLAPTAHPVNVAPDYIIGADDVLAVTVSDNPNFSAASLLVRSDGKITLPMIGDIQAAGFTPMQLSANITTSLKQLILDTVNVTVSVLASNSKRVYMIGEISHVGPIGITPGMTILQAIATAGGLTPYANKKHIYILRGEPGKQKSIPFDYTRALRKGDMQGITLVPGDTIVVP